MKNAYTENSIWRNRDTFLKGHDAIVDFLSKKWAKENGYRLRKELFAFQDNKVGGRTRLSFSQGWPDLSFSFQALGIQCNVLTYEFINRLPSSSGMNGTTRQGSGIDAMVLKIGLSRMMAGCGRGR